MIKFNWSIIDEAKIYFIPRNKSILPDNLDVNFFDRESPLDLVKREIQESRRGLVETRIFILD